MALTLHLVRHGRATDVDGRCIGQTDRPLSADGIAECQALAATPGWPALRGISSDLCRASQSAALLTTDVVATTPLLREMHFGAWEDRTWSQLEAEDGDRLQAWMADWVKVRAPGGESFTDVMARARHWVETLPPADEPLLVVAHAGIIRALAVVLLNVPAGNAFALRVDHAHVSTLSLSPHGASLVRWNSRTL